MGRLRGSLFYLAGGIQYIDDLGINWRKEAERELRSLGVGVLNPMDKASNYANEDKDTQANLKQLQKKAESAKSQNDFVNMKKYHDEISDIMKAIVSIDLRMVDLASALLVKIDSTKHTAGTYAELTQAYLQRKPVVMFSDRGIYDIPLWWWGHGEPDMFFDSLSKALSYIKEVDRNPNVYHYKQWKMFDYNKIYGENFNV